MGTIFTFLLAIFFIRFIFKNINQSLSSNGDRYGGYTYEYGQSRRFDFIKALLILIAAMMKADGNVKRVELDYVKARLVQILGYEEAKNAVLQLRDILKTNNNLYNAMIQIRTVVDYHSRLEILNILYGIAKADGVVSPDELTLIRNIASGIGISAADTESIIGTYASPNNIDAAYKVLEITPDATDDEVKKAYRTMAMKYHPDKVAGLGDEIVKNAEMRFRKVQEAYENIKKTRDMK